jgi:hypothetical protein
MPGPGRIMTDFFALSTKNDIDNNIIDIDNILCFNGSTFLVYTLIEQEGRGGDAPPAAGQSS